MQYRHYKGGIYTVISPRARHTETLELHVVYSNEKGEVWIRPIDMFYGYTEDGQKRFVPLPKAIEPTAIPNER